MEGWVRRHRPQFFFLFFFPPPRSSSSHPELMSARVCALSSHEPFSFLRAAQPKEKKKSRFRKLSVLIEIINPFYSFPDFHFGRSIIEVKKKKKKRLLRVSNSGVWRKPPPPPQRDVTARVRPRNNISRRKKRRTRGLLTAGTLPCQMR